MENTSTKPKKPTNKSKTEHKPKKSNANKKEKTSQETIDKLNDSLNTYRSDSRQQTLAKQQAETLKQYASRLKKPELASNPNAQGRSGALRLRLDLNLDADIRIKARIKGSVKLTLL